MKYDIDVEERGRDAVFTVVVESPATTAETDEFVVVGDDRILTHDTTFAIKSVILTSASNSIPVVVSDPFSSHIPKSLDVPPEEPDEPKPEPEDPQTQNQKTQKRRRCPKK